MGLDDREYMRERRPQRARERGSAARPGSITKGGLSMTGFGSAAKLLAATIARGGIDPIRVSRRIRGTSGSSC